MSNTEIAGFKKHISRGRAGVPKVSIRKNGQMAFNAGAVVKYDLHVFKYVMFYISDDKSRIAIRFTNNEKESGLVAVQHRPGSFAFSARNFLEINDVEWSRTVNYDFTWDDRDKIAIFKWKEKDNARQEKGV